ncbi:MAG: hypothetical protein H0U03_13590 [Actinobacteria bacterium]|nr:hypothetical protein [Actinomycetota bacterium]
MEEARQVIERLRRIELLESERADPFHVLAEVQELLVEARLWIAAEHHADELAEAALRRLEAALAEGRVPSAAR